MIVVNTHGSTLMSQCCNAPARWLDCDDCATAGVTCQIIVCVDCGDTVIESPCPTDTATGGE